MSSTTSNKCLLILSISILTLVIACAETHTPVGLDGTVKIFSNSPQNPIFGQDSDWARIGNARNINIKSVYKGAIPVLQVSSAYSNVAFLRRMNAQLLATPFLFWSWAILDGPAIHPVNLVVGFSDTTEGYDKDNNGGVIFNKKSLPPFSRTLTLVWGASALERGTLISDRNSRTGKPAVRYIVRGGRENRRQWWRESIDLSQIHAAAWPKVDISKSRVVFTGISALSGAVPGTMQIARLRLSR